MIEIKHRYTGSVIWSGDVATVRDAVIKCCEAGIPLSGANLRSAYLRSANLSSADLSSADLSSANLSSAYLSGANLRSADLRSADLSSAYLRSAYLRSANLRSADLSSADLSSANLSSAYLRSADLSSANLNHGITWDKYVTELVPALLTAGGKTLAEVLDSGCWDCHSWTNCPMAVAFGVDDLSKIPPLYRAEASRFISFFDAKLLPKPEVKA